MFLLHLTIRHVMTDRVSRLASTRHNPVSPKTAYVLPVAEDGYKLRCGTTIKLHDSIYGKYIEKTLQKTKI